jgi:hypothetical protein
LSHDYQIGGSFMQMGKISNLVLLWLCIGIITLFLIIPVSAEPGITVTPGAINFTATSDSVITRSVMVTAKENITSLKLIPQDMTDGTGAGVVHQDDIYYSHITSTMINGSVQPVPVNFNLAGATGGRYAGELWFSYSDEGVVIVPVTATIKAGWFLPFVVLIAGIIVSYSLFCYGKRYKRRDEITKMVEIIENNANQDKLLKTPVVFGRSGENDKKTNIFYDQICGDIIRIREKLDFNEITEAESWLTRLQSSWDSWNTNRTNLVGFYDSFEKLVVNLNELELKIVNKREEDGKDEKYANTTTEVPAIKEIRENLQEKFKAIQTGTDVKDLKDEANKFDTLNNALSNIQEIEKILKRPGDSKNEKIDELWKKLQNVTLDQVNSVKQEIDEKLKDVSKDHVQSLHPIYSATETPGAKHTKTFDFKEPDTRKESSKWAGVRLWLYDWGSFTVTVAILAMAGFSQLYLSNPTFGATPGDWITLALWGLLVGPTADAVSEKTKGTVGIG